MTGAQQRELHREREQRMVADALARIAPPHMKETPRAKPGDGFVGPLAPPVDDAQHLAARGWVRCDVTRQDYVHQITWWCKDGRKFPQHFALWLERVNRAWWPA